MVDAESGDDRLYVDFCAIVEDFVFWLVPDFVVEIVVMA
jgi:hypothetical protein